MFPFPNITHVLTHIVTFLFCCHWLSSGSYLSVVPECFHGCGGRLALSWVKLCHCLSTQLSMNSSLSCSEFSLCLSILYPWPLFCLRGAMKTLSWQFHHVPWLDLLYVKYPRLLAPEVRVRTRNSSQISFKWVQCTLGACYSSPFCGTWWRRLLLTVVFPDKLAGVLGSALSCGAP